MGAYGVHYIPAIWQATADVATRIRNSIFLPTNHAFTDQANQLVPVPPVHGPGVELNLAMRKTMLSRAMLRLAIHNLPLVRDFQPEMGQLLSATFLPPFGYAVVAELGGCMSELTGLMPGRWPPKWTFEAIGRTHRLRADMPPSYVIAGSATAHLEGPDGTQVFRFSHNGYRALWDAIGRTVRDSEPALISLDIAIADLVFALDLADGIDAMLEQAA